MIRFAYLVFVDLLCCFLDMNLRLDSLWFVVVESAGWHAVFVWLVFYFSVSGIHCFAIHLRLSCLCLCLSRISLGLNCLLR